MAIHRALLIAQSPVLRIGIRGLLEAALHVDDIVEADGALESIAPIAAAAPDLVVIQDALPGITGIVAARMVRELRPRASIIVLSDHVTGAGPSATQRRDADALLPSTVRTEHFLSTIERLARDHTARDALVTPALPEERGPDTDELAELRADDLAILDGLARGFSGRDLASHLLVSEQTVRLRTSALVRKLKAVDRTTAVVAAVKSGLVDLSAQLPAVHLELAASA